MPEIQGLKFLTMLPEETETFWHWLFFIEKKPAVLYGCETWSLSLRKGTKLMALRKIFGWRNES